MFEVTDHFFFKSEKKNLNVYQCLVIAIQKSFGIIKLIIKKIYLLLFLKL